MYEFSIIMIVLSAVFLGISAFAAFIFWDRARGYITSRGVASIVPLMLIISLVVSNASALIASVLSIFSGAGDAFIAVWWVFGVIFIVIEEMLMPKPPYRAPGRVEISLQGIDEGMATAKSPWWLIVIVAAIVPLFVPFIGGGMMLFYCHRVRPGAVSSLVSLKAAKTGTADAVEPPKASWGEPQEPEEEPVKEEIEEEPVKEKVVMIIPPKKEKTTEARGRKKKPIKEDPEKKVVMTVKKKEESD